VVVIGGGDGALQAALELAATCSSVSVVVRGRLRARQAYVDAAARRANLHFVWDSTVDAILGDAGVSGVRVLNHKSGVTMELPCHGVFPLLGVVPNSEFASAAIQLAADGHILVGPGLETTAAGIYAIGAVRAGFSGALASAAGEGAAVAVDLARRLRK
jgi:thioredoxin reductase (NADPH)